jgi:hexosaminidase
MRQKYLTYFIGAIKKEHFLSVLSFTSFKVSQAALLVLCCLLYPFAQSPAPLSIPSVRQWAPGTGVCAFGSSSRIVVDAGDPDSLALDAETFAEDISGLISRSVTVSRAASGEQGDIFLKLNAADTSLGEEGYRLSIADKFEISAKTPAGVFYGTRTLLQLLRQGKTISQGTIVDWPKGRWRGIMVDAGRKYYTLPWLRTLIQDMAYLKMNLFHFHLSDGLSKTNSGGFRLQSSIHPEIASAAFYSKADIQSLVALAARYHVTIVPEIDFPGHVNWLYASHRNLLLGSKVLGNQYWALDLSKDSSYSFVRDIYEEFMPLFPGPFWHCGADEYMFVDEFASFPQLAAWAKNRYGAKAHANDCYRHFVNWADDIVKSHGKRAWAWNDVLLGIAGESVGACTVASDIWIDHWGALNWIGWGGVYPSAELSRGCAMVNSSWDIYYILTNDAKSTGDPKWAYDNWALNVFAGGTIAAGDPHIKGGTFPIWGDVPDAETEAQVFANTFMLSRAVAKKCWDSPRLYPAYADFRSLSEAIGRAPIPTAPIHVTAHKAPQRRTITAAAQLFDCNGAFIGTFGADDIAKCDVRTLSRQAMRVRRPLCTRPYIARFKDNGKNAVEMILFIGHP